MAIRQPGQWPPVTALWQPADYVDDLKRGTVEYSPQWRNYAYHAVTVPVGTIIQGANFAQAVPLTEVFTLDRPGTITVVDCNLCNVKPSTRVLVQNGMTVQSWIVLVGGVQDRQFLTGRGENLVGTVLEPPLNVVLPTGVVISPLPIPSL